jgi:hypothetical protein
MSNTLWDSRLIAEEYAAGEGMASVARPASLKHQSGAELSPREHLDFL